MPVRKRRCPQVGNQGCASGFYSRHVGAELLTDRLSLRRPVRADLDIILAIHRDERACAHNPSDMLAAAAAADDLYRRWDDHWQHHGFGYWTIRARNAREPVGFCGIKLMRFHDHDVLNLFYRLSPSAWGNGLATDAATAVFGWVGERRPQYGSAHPGARGRCGRRAGRRCLFVDDSAPNVDVARRLGIRAALFTGIETLPELGHPLRAARDAPGRDRAG